MKSIRGLSGLFLLVCIFTMLMIADFQTTNNSVSIYYFWIGSSIIMILMMMFFIINLVYERIQQIQLNRWFKSFHEESMMQEKKVHFHLFHLNK